MPPRPDWGGSCSTRCPPPEPTTADTDARIALADRELRLLAQVSADLDSIHEYSRSHDQGVPLGDVVHVPIGGVHVPLPRPELRGVARRL